MFDQLSSRADFVGWLLFVFVGAVAVLTLGTIGSIASGKWQVAALSIGPYFAMVGVQAGAYVRKARG